VRVLRERDPEREHFLQFVKETLENLTDEGWSVASATPHGSRHPAENAAVRPPAPEGSWVHAQAVRRVALPGGAVRSSLLTLG
jgi:hypothetical protein